MLLATAPPSLQNLNVLLVVMTEMMVMVLVMIMIMVIIMMTMKTDHSLPFFGK